ncbi:Uma2 family endonuclease [Pleurocapsa sp. PCC 7319]|uniref:Uma2 family endonuclease n=1 Tax=Pleurocapsa sp. PCC 7319 TaxID=118161 RepID=UPI00034B9182|nr:Uma2 family endonuclease [Pleurocapsa sp. PCC 7319]
MIASPDKSYLTPEEYLQLEAASDSKHEYINGEIYAMAGATDTHVTIALNIAVMLRNHLRGSGCRVFISDMKVRIETKNRFYYPDVMVTCELKDRENSTYKQFPRLIIEVLSDSTEAFDRGDKFADYQSLPSLQEYVLINTKKARIECFRRTEEGLWLLQFYELEDGQFKLTNIDFTGNISDVYEEVEFVEPSAS